MKLSEAISLGATITELKPYLLDSCALGAAANAVGIARWGRWEAISQRWPWLEAKAEKRMGYAFHCGGLNSSDNYWNEIAVTFNQGVSMGKMTLEQLIDYVRSVEPSCGECNQFECTCAKAEALVEKEEQLQWT